MSPLELRPPPRVPEQTRRPAADWNPKSRRHAQANHRYSRFFAGELFYPPRPTHPSADRSRESQEPWMDKSDKQTSGLAVSLPIRLSQFTGWRQDARVLQKFDGRLFVTDHSGAKRLHLSMKCVFFVPPGDEWQRVFRLDVAHFYKFGISQGVCLDYAEQS